MQTTERTERPETADALDAILALVRLAHNSHGRLANALGIDPDRSLLMVLAVAKEYGPLPIGEIAKRTGLSASVVSRIASSLTEAGLVRRAESDTDKRAKTISVTEAGVAKLGEVAAVTHGFFDRALAGWSIENLVALSSLLRMLVADLEDAIEEVETDGTRLRKAELNVRVGW